MIFFDIDDTLLDYKTSQDFAALEFAKKYPDHIADPNEFPQVWDALAERHIGRYLKGELSFQEQRRERIRESLGLALSSQEADSIFSEYYKIHEESWRLFPEVESVLLKLVDLSLGVITNGDKENQTHKLKKLGIFEYFDEVITPDCAGAAKPASAIFKLAAIRAKKPTEQCWYVGDNYNADYLGAKQAGFKSVWLNRNGADEPCDSQCQDLQEFLVNLS